MPFRKETIEKTLATFNEREVSKAKLLSCGDAFVAVEFSGKNFEFETEESFFDLKAELEEATHEALEVEKIEKLARTYRVRFVLAGKSPADEIIGILKKYDEGTPPRAPESSEDED